MRKLLLLLFTIHFSLFTPIKASEATQENIMAAILRSGRGEAAPAKT